MSKSEQIKKNIYFKIWDYFVLFLVVIAIGLLIHSYFEITPVLQSKFEIYNIIIAVIFLIDVVIRIILFKKEYFFSTEIIIDVLACSDVLTPALRAIRGIKYTRFIRILRVLRMLRIFRALKTVKHTTQSVLEEKLFNSISIILILGFIIISLITAGFIDKRLMSFLEDNYSTLVKTLVLSSKNDQGKFDPDKFIHQLKLIDDVFYYKIDMKTSETKLEDYINTTQKEVSETYFPDEILEVNISNTIIVKVLIKEIKFYVRIVEFIILISSLPLLFLLLLILHLTIKKFFMDPVNKFEEAIEHYQEFKKIELDEKLKDTVIYKLQENYNNALDYYNSKLWEYYEAYNQLQDGKK
ncbi:ion transporter [Candidatus Dependentiae bacterium]|nr:ion transporter [Candidatus Dependentiae bacterium]